MNPRIDANIIAYVQRRSGSDAAKAMQSLPFIEISQHTGDHTIFPAVPGVGLGPDAFLGGGGDAQAIANASEDYRINVYALKNLPWSEFVLCGWAMRTRNAHVTTPRFRFFLHVMQRTIWQKKVMQPIHLFVDIDGLGVFMENIAYAIETGKNSAHDALFYNQTPAYQALRSAELLGLYTLSYLALCPDRIVRVVPCGRPSRQARKAAERDPSQRVDLPTHILVDPAKAPDYQPPEMRDMVQSLGIARQPHRRRSHWRRLPDKVVRVRESWIGPADWEYQGRSYRVVNTIDTLSK